MSDPLWPSDAKFKRRDRVEKISGSSWHGRVVGWYGTVLTPVGYAVESEREPGSVQSYPEAAFAPASAPPLFEVLRLAEQALLGARDEWEKLTRYGSPLAAGANENFQRVDAALVAIRRARKLAREPAT